VTNRTSSLEQRILELEDREKIRSLVWSYGHAVDRHRFDELFALFTEDCVMDYRPYAEPFRGKAALMKTFLALPQNHKMTLHLTSDPIINVSGDEASGIWHWLNPSTGYREGRERAIWQAGYYSMSYRRNGDDWLISEIKVEYVFSSDHEHGWVQDAMNLPDASGPAS